MLSPKSDAFANKLDMFSNMNVFNNDKDEEKIIVFM
jgi:hypothetical protein